MRERVDNRGASILSLHPTAGVLQRDSTRRGSFLIVHLSAGVLLIGLQKFPRDACLVQRLRTAAPLRYLLPLLWVGGNAVGAVSRGLSVVHFVECVSSVGVGGRFWECAFDYPVVSHSFGFPVQPSVAYVPGA